MATTIADVRHHRAGPPLIAAPVARRAFSGMPSTSLVPELCPNLTFGSLGKPSQGTVLQCLVQHGYTQWTRYQPASRFWAFPVDRRGWLLALSVVLLGVTVWLARRRAT
jgi:hypothetical protein